MRMIVILSSFLSYVVKIIPYEWTVKRTDKYTTHDMQNDTVLKAILQKLKYDIHTKFPLELYQIQFWYDSRYEYYTLVFAVNSSSIY